MRMSKVLSGLAVAACFLPAVQVFAAPTLEDAARDAQSIAKASMEQPKRADELRQKGEVEIEKNLPIPKSDATEAKFEIKKIVLDALDLNLPAAELEAITSGAIGQGKTLNDLNIVAAKITVYARQQGYPAAAAFLPAQDSMDGSFIIKVIPGRYGDVKLDNQTKMKEETVRSFLHGWKKGEIIFTKDIETALYSISDVAGTKAIGVLAPGKEFGTSDITVRVEAGKDRSTVAYVENYGNQNSGRYRFGLQHTIYDVNGTGGKFSVGTLHSNSNLHNYYINYEALVGRGGTTLGIGYSRMDYTLGGIMRTLYGATGTADTFSIFGSRPIYHLTDKELRFVYGADYRLLKDHMDKVGAYTDSEKSSKNIHVGVEGSQRTNGAYITYDATFTVGNFSADSAWAKTLARQAGTEGGFTKLELNTSATKGIGHRSDVTLKLSGQITDRNLDSSEEFYLGGPRGVRAYAQGAGSGDEGWLGSIETRFYTDDPGLVFSTYFDGGQIKMHHSGGVGNDTMTLKGWGIGLAYNKAEDWFARLDYARRIGSTKESDPSKARTWFILGKIW